MAERSHPYPCSSPLHSNVLWGVYVLRGVYFPFSIAGRCMSPGATAGASGHIPRSRLSDQASHVVPTRGPHPPHNRDTFVCDVDGRLHESWGACS